MSFMGTPGEFALSPALVLQYLLGLLHVQMLRAGPGDLPAEVVLVLCGWSAGHGLCGREEPLFFIAGASMSPVQNEDLSLDVQEFG